MYLSRVAAIDGGLPQDVPAINVNRLCGSGLKAIVSAAQSVMLGDADVAIGGGAESMSRGPYIVPRSTGPRRGPARRASGSASPRTRRSSGLQHDPTKHAPGGEVLERAVDLGQRTQRQRDLGQRHPLRQRDQLAQFVEPRDV